MADVVITIPASYTTVKHIKPRMYSTQFGDGYVQESGKGINNTPQEWAITISNIKTADADTLEAALLSAIGFRILWTPPTTGATQLKWRVPDDISRTFVAPGTDSFSFTLRQAF